MRTSALITLAALFTLPSAAGAEVFTWKDASGKTVYSDKPPLEKVPSARELRARGSAGGETVTAPARKADDATTSGSPPEGGAAPAKSAEQLKAEADARSKLCNNASKRLIQLESDNGILVTKNQKGESVPLVGDARKAETEAARKDVDQWCK